MMHFAVGSDDMVIDQQQAGRLIDELLAKLGPLRRVLIIPPDYSRVHSWAGTLTSLLWNRLSSSAHVEIMPALGTHVPMKAEQLSDMFKGVPLDAFRVHDWKNALVTLGEVPSEFVRKVSEGKVSYPIKIQCNRLLVEGNWDRIISVGQLVPHEVIGIANHNKNVFVGVGGSDTINKSHFLGAVHNMERIMGRASTPVRDVLNYGEKNFAKHLPLTYLLTVRQRLGDGTIVTRGLFAGDDAECFLTGAELCRRVNIQWLERPLDKVVVYLDPDEFESTWLGNKAVYRTRMAIADNGELIIIAPGVDKFGEDPTIDRLIRRYGYRGTPTTLSAVENDPELAENLSAAAHLIHGSSEGRFRIRYCTKLLTEDEIRGVGFDYGDYATYADRYNHLKLKDGINHMDSGEEIFFISNPGLGLWSVRERSS